MTVSQPLRVSVAVPVPLARPFDYAVPDGMVVQAGQRVQVPFGARLLVGLVLEVASAPADETAAQAERIKPVQALLDPEPLAPASWLAALRWAADYYHHPLGEVIGTALPPKLRAGASAAPRRPRCLQRTALGETALATLPPRRKVLRTVLQACAAPGYALPPGEGFTPLNASACRQALAEGWLEWSAIEPVARSPTVAQGPPLTAAQATVWQAMDALPAGFTTVLLEGVTGSGKTELYLQAAAKVLAAGRQVLVLVPEIGLTPQLLARFSARFGSLVVSSHSGMGEAERLTSWLAIRDGTARVLVGTRSAVFAPFEDLGLVVVDEEHDASYKQQDGLRYHARDFALVRAQMAGALALLGSATPSLETLANAEAGRYRHLRLSERIGGSAPPRPQCIDLNRFAPREGLSEPLVTAAQRHVAAGGQALLFINRRGFSPTLFCGQCHWAASCPRCDARLTVHQARRQLECHHCGQAAPLPRQCPRCDHRELVALGEGTERIEDALRNHLPGVRIERFDAERFSSGRALAALLEEVRERRVQVLVGTQMLAKGHDFGALSLVGVVNADAALYSADFRATERLAQLLTQVAGRAGRSSQAPLPPEVLIQTREPDHPLLRQLIEQGYAKVAQTLLEERRAAGLPPAQHLAVLRAEAATADEARQFLLAARDALPAVAGVDRLGPAPALLARRAGRHRAQLLLLASERRQLHRLLLDWQLVLAALPGARRVRYSLDIDPADLS